jgi:hypothetical protein
MKRFVQYMAASLAITVATVLFGYGVVHADVNDFVVTDFRADYVINNDKIGGSLETTEEIDVAFPGQNHGILRAIPQSYQGYKTKLTLLSIERDGAGEPYSTYTENNNLVLKIGDANKTITGTHRYILKYQQERIINFDAAPQFYWDTNGDQWDQPFDHTQVSVTYKGHPLTTDNSYCYTGVRGSSARDCTIKQKGESLIITANHRLGPHENMTLQIPMKQGEFVAPTWKQKVGDNLWSLVAVGLGLAAAVSAFVIWLRFGKDYKDRGIIVPEYAPPKDLTPAEVGLLADYKVDGRDISATLIDMAVRGYIKIYDDTKKVLFFKNRSYRLELLKESFTGLKQHETSLLAALFPTKKKGDIIELKKLNRITMAKAIEEIRSKLTKDLSETYGLIEPKGLKLQVWMYVAGFVVGFLLIAIFRNGGAIFGGFIASISFFFFASFMTRRSHAGVEMYEKIKGLELYMKTAEKDRLKMMQSVDRPYAEPSKTVELFEKLLPYAVALKVEKSWAKQFDSILTETPGWYQGSNIAAFSAVSLASDLGSATTSFSQSFESSSGTSSSSGGGSSGGGGGGGGGGGW